MAISLGHLRTRIFSNPKYVIGKLNSIRRLPSHSFWWLKCPGTPLKKRKRFFKLVFAVKLATTQRMKRKTWRTKCFPGCTKTHWLKHTDTHRNKKSYQSLGMYTHGAYFDSYVYFYTYRVYYGHWRHRAGDWTHCKDNLTTFVKVPGYGYYWQCCENNS